MRIEITNDEGELIAKHHFSDAKSRSFMKALNASRKSDSRKALAYMSFEEGILKSVEKSVSGHLNQLLEDVS